MLLTNPFRFLDLHVFLYMPVVLGTLDMGFLKQHRQISWDNYDDIGLSLDFPFILLFLIASMLLFGCSIVLEWLASIRTTAMSHFVSLCYKHLFLLDALSSFYTIMLSSFIVPHSVSITCHPHISSYVQASSPYPLFTTVHQGLNQHTDINIYLLDFRLLLFIQNHLPW